MLLGSARFDPEGLPLQLVYGDAASTAATFTYDARKRLATYRLDRAAPALWQNATPTYPKPTKETTPLAVSAQQLSYDDVDHPIRVQDGARRFPAACRSKARYTLGHLR